MSVRELDSSFKFDDLKKLGRVLGSSATVCNSLILCRIKLTIFQGPRKPIKRVEVKPQLPPTPSSSTTTPKDTSKTKAPEPAQKAPSALKEKPKLTGKLEWGKPKGNSTPKPAQPAAPPPTQESSKKPVAKTTNTPVKKEPVEVSYVQVNSLNIIMTLS